MLPFRPSREMMGLNLGFVQGIDTGNKQSLQVENKFPAKREAHDNGNSYRQNP
jgi:hypothetical protein